MPNELFKQYGNSAPKNPMLERILNFKKQFSGNPQQVVQNLLNSGKVSQTQMNQYIQQTNQIYKQFKDIM